MKCLSILGSTGSIGKQSIEVALRRGYKISALAAHSNISLLEEQARRFSPELVCVYDHEKYKLLKSGLADTNIRVVCGMEGLCEAATVKSAHTVINSVVGMIGLIPTIEAINAEKDIALANKETLVVGGEIVMKLAEEKKVRIMPVDSEHSAIFQCINAGRRQDVKRIILTASGGPFFGKTADELKDVTVEDALCHPNWSMGAKITVDSATMMNKGLELIEAAWLFGLSADKIDIIVHRESVIHSAVEFADSSVIAQMGVPDMKIPIQYALTYPERVESGVKQLSLLEYGKLTFYPPDEKVFCCLAAAKQALDKGGVYPAYVNCANEKAVELFLNGKISFLDIGKIVCGTLSLPAISGPLTLEKIEKARAVAEDYAINCV